MKKTALLLSLFCFAFFAKAQQASVSSVSQNYSSKIINSSNHTFGYDIFVNGKMVIHQPTPPGFSGNNGFKKKQDAEKVAKLVIEKMKKGEMPPTISMDDLKNLKIDF